MITEDYVSFETAKLLKEKGFDCCCKVWYSEYTSPYGAEKYISIEFDSHNKFNENYEFICPAPTLQMAMKWLREVHKLGVFPTTYYREINRNAKHDYGSTIVMLDTYEVIGNDKNIEDYTFEAETYEETAEKAIMYCLKNLI